MQKFKGGYFATLQRLFPEIELDPGEFPISKKKRVDEEEGKK